MKAIFLMVICVLCSNVANGSEAALKNFFAKVQTLQAGFEQQVFDESGMSLESSQGTFSLSRPGKFRWNYASTDSTLALGPQIVADGESILMYDPDLEQLTKRRLSDALAQVPSLLLVQTGTDIENHFVITDFGLTDGLTWVALKPRDENAAYQQLMVGFEQDVLRSITLFDGLGNETRLRFRHVQSNVDLPANTFTIDVPEGVDVLSE